MNFFIRAAIVGLLATTACAPKGYNPYFIAEGTPAASKDANHARFTLERTACFGFCPVYKVSVDDRDILIFEGKRFVAEEGGSVSKRLPDGSYKQLAQIAEKYRFNDFDPAYPNEAGDNCGPIATDLPTIIIGFDSKPVEHQVRLYQGCFRFDGRERFDQMALEMDDVLDIDEFVGPREQFTDAKE